MISLFGRHFGRTDLGFSLAHGIRALSNTHVNESAKAVKYLKSQRKKQKNQAKQAALKESTEHVDPVLGREHTPFIDRIMAEIKEPAVLANGYNKTEVDKYLSALDATRFAQVTLSDKNVFMNSGEPVESLEERREAVMRILSMRNADNKSSVKLALTLAREDFQRFPGDTGSSEVQAACMTVRIQNLAHHVKEHKKDSANTRKLRMLVQQRQSILRYLKRDKPERYYWTIQKLGLTDEAISTEFNLDRRYFQDYKFFGDDILIKDSKKVAEQKRRELRKQKRASDFT